VLRPIAYQARFCFEARLDPLNRSMQEISRDARLAERLLMVYITQRSMLVALGIVQDHVSGMPTTRRVRGMSALRFGPYIFWRIRLAVAISLLDLSTKEEKVIRQNSGELVVFGTLSRRFSRPWQLRHPLVRGRGFLISPPTLRVSAKV
jgi:hypothetical protein